MKNVLFMTYNLAPYRVAQLNSFSRVCNLKVIYSANQRITRKWQMNQDITFNEINVNGKFKFKSYYLFYFGLRKLVKEADYIFLGGYDSPLAWYLMILGKVYEKKLVFVMDGISPYKINKQLTKNFTIKKLFISAMDFAFANGEVSKKYLTGLFRFKEDKIYNQYLTIDSELIRSIKNDRETLKKVKEEKIKKFGNKKVVIYSGRLLSGKKVDNVILAINEIKNKDDYVLLILGDGPEREKLSSLANLYNINIHIEGFVENQSKLFKNYLLGDYFILPSEDDAWGLVVNEAIEMGLPVIVSDGCGCYFDFVKEEKNGFSFKAGDVNRLSDCILKVSEIDNKLLKQAQDEILSKWNMESSVNQFIKLVEEN